MKNGEFGTGDSRPIFLDNVRCTGHERELLNCSFDSVSNCDHSEDAGVICGAVCRNGTVRLAIGDINDLYLDPDNVEDTYFIKEELAMGRVEVCIGGRYGTVCDNDWNFVDASVVCSQLGFSYYGKAYCVLSIGCQLFQTGAITITGGHFSNDSVPVLIGRVECSGNENKLLECAHVTESHEEVFDCDPREVAAMSCQGLQSQKRQPTFLLLPSILLRHFN